MNICYIEGCERKNLAKGLCGKHYQRQARWKGYSCTYYQHNKLKIKERHAKRMTDPVWLERHRKLNRIRHKKRRLQVLIIYGGNPPKCACCGETRYEFLSIDHINGKGNKHRKQIHKEGINPSLATCWLKKNGYPKGFQVLCHNCNFAKGLYGKCPHENTT